MDAHELAINNFQIDRGFCWSCGSILSVLGESGSVKCFVCRVRYRAEVFGDMGHRYEICFHPRFDYQRSETAVAGPIVERKCIKCGNDTMSYATLQLRSADEGQTVFYTCNRCGYKESENS